MGQRGDGAEVSCRGWSRRYIAKYVTGESSKNQLPAPRPVRRADTGLRGASAPTFASKRSGVRFPAAPRTGVADALTRNSDCCADRGRTGCWAVASWADPPGPRGRAGRWAALPRRGLRRAGWPCRGWGRRVVMPRSRVRMERGAGQKLSDPKRRHTTVARTGHGTGDDGSVSPDVAHLLF